MNPLSGLITVLLLNFAMATSQFTGAWKLLSAQDENNNAVTLPSGQYALKVKEKDERHLDIFIKVGNSLRGEVTLEGEDHISVSGIMSTMMMPPEPQYLFEMYLSKALPKMTNLILDGNKLIFEGEGRIEFESE